LFEGWLQGTEVLEGKVGEDDGLKGASGHRKKIRDQRRAIVNRISVIRHYGKNQSVAFYARRGHKG
jgi:hypothetical protein